ncbi:MAG: hypothetical protein Q9N34_04160 [Aquificota bacterium]|nr:hypothetical protein [Aquificota bacterium]
MGVMGEEPVEGIASKGFKLSLGKGLQNRYGGFNVFVAGKICGQEVQGKFTQPVRGCGF